MSVVTGSVGRALVAAAIVLAATPLVRRLATRLGVVAQPRADRWHRGAVPALGGVAIVAGVAISFALRGTGIRDALPMVLTGAGMFAVGLVDDFVHFKPVAKLSAQIAVACGVVAIAPPSLWTGFAALDAVLTIFWIIAITNALNLLDNMDGLCVGVTAIAALGCWADLAGGASPAADFAACLTGACLAFLVFNFSPASVFMGDGGSLFLGGSLAMLAVFGKSPAQSHVLSALAGPVLLLLIPIFDTTFVTMSRLLSGRAASIGGRDHTSHRLVALGFSERRAVLILYALAALAVTAAVLARRAPEASVVGPVMVIVVILLGLQLARVRVYDGMDYSVLTSGRFTPLLVNVAFKRRIFEMLLDAVLVAIAYYASYVIRFGAQTPLYAALISRSLPLVIAIQVLGFFSVGVYRGTWRYISLPDLSVVARGVALGVGCSMLAIVIVYRFDGYSRSVFVIDAMLVGLLVAGARLSERIVADAAGQERRTGRRALLYGAGDSGVLLVRELRSNPQHLYYPVAFLDDDAAKEGRRILGVPVVGGIAGLDRAIVRLRPDALIISTRRIAPARLASVHRVCRRAGTPVLSFECSIQHAAVPGHAGLAARHMP